MKKIQDSISVFFPCYNDAGTIASMVIRAYQTLSVLTDTYEVLVIDDASSDDSRDILLALQKDYSDLRLIFHDKNKGYGGALRSGFAHATGNLVFYTDGDAQYDVAELTVLVARLSDTIDIVNGYKIKRHDPLHRKIIGFFYQYTMKWLFCLPIRDVDCDFRLIRRHVLETITLTHNSGVICVEMIRKMHDQGYTFVEVPVRHYFRLHGASQFFNTRRIMRALIALVGLWFQLVWRKKK